MATVIVNSGQTYTVSSGRTDTHDVVFSGGILFIESGGTASGTTLSGGILQAGSGFMLDGEAVSGGDAIDTTILSGGVEVIKFAGTATSTIINGGTELIGSGGTASGTIINSGSMLGVGFDEIPSGGVGTPENGLSINATVNSGGLEEIDLGVAVGTTISDGGKVQVGGFSFPASGDPAVARDTTIHLGGEQDVMAGAVAINTTLLGGVEVVFGKSNSATVYSGTQVVEALATTTGTVLSGGEQLQAFERWPRRDDDN
jgi:autotransporter passenger strand-loop-strand repeat protein